MPRLQLASTVGWGFPTWQEDEEVGLLASFGIRRVQIFRNAEKAIRADDVRRRLAEHGIMVTSLHAFFGDDYDPSQLDEARRRKVVDNLAREADFCLELGGGLVVVHPGDAKLGDAMRDPQRIDALDRSAEALADVGSRKGMVFALENLQPGQMGSDMAVLRRIADRVDSPHLGLNYDCGHANLTSDPMTVLDQAGPRIVSVHIHDNFGQSDDHLAPGFGKIDMDAVCRGLARHGYKGDFVLELMETTESLRTKCDAAWAAKLQHWLDLAGGVAS